MSINAHLWVRYLWDSIGACEGIWPPNWDVLSVGPNAPPLPAGYERPAQLTFRSEATSGVFVDRFILQVAAHRWRSPTRPARKSRLTAEEPDAQQQYSSWYNTINTESVAEVGFVDLLCCHLCAFTVRLQHASPPSGSDSSVGDIHASVPVRRRGACLGLWRVQRRRKCQLPHLLSLSLL